MLNAKGSQMESSVKPKEGESLLLEGISMLLSRWNGLQMAIQNEWGGRDSLRKSQQLACDILSWFSQSKEATYVEDLENLLHESLLLSFNTDIEDGSIEEVAEQLMIMHEEYLQGIPKPAKDFNDYLNSLAAQVNPT